MMLFFALACGPKEAPLENPMSSAIPTVPPAKPFSPPEALISQLPNKSSLWLHEDHRLPLVVFKIVLPGGGASDPSGEWGRADLVSEMLNESVGELDTLEFASLLNTAAANYSVSTGRTSTIVTLSLHRDRLEELLPIVADAIYRPSFSEKDWDRVVENQITSLEQMNEDARSMASMYAGYFYHGTEHPLGSPLYGTVKTAAAVDREKSKSWHLSRLVGDQISFAIAGDINAEDATKLIGKHFPDWPGTEFTAPSVPDNHTPANDSIVLIDMPGAQQTTIRLSSSAYPKGSDLTVPAEVAGIVMGASFASRLNNLLREEKGYTYGIGCSFSEGVYGNSFSLSTSVRTDATTPALQDIISTLASAKEPYSEEDLMKGTKTLRTDVIDSVSSLSGIASVMTSSIQLKRSPNYGSQYLELARAVTTEDMLSAGPWFQPDKGIIIIAGDANVIAQPLTEAGFEIKRVELPQ
ncbi:MAG: hypothetical protein CMK59_08740 [Proteobacteria bacterium]|nr:hypothetical protein [Pseudomonadota bacterium]